MPNKKVTFINLSEPLVKVCKHSKLKGECMNITKATPDLGDFNDAVSVEKRYQDDL